MTPEEEAVVRAYRSVFGSPAGQIALQDLMRFCKFRTPIDSHVDEGKRQVFLRILTLSKFSDEQLVEIYSDRRLNPGGTE